MLISALSVVIGFIDGSWRLDDLPKCTWLVVEPGTAKVF